MPKLYKAIRRYEVTEEVQVFAESEYEARVKMEDDLDGVTIINEIDGDYEISSRISDITLQTKVGDEK